MIKICLLEDEASQTLAMQQCLKRFADEHTGFEYVLESFDRAVTLLDHYHPDVDLLFLDIRMPDISGMEVAHRIREIDQNVTIIFVTNLTQYAIEGYSVGAFDYILKPLNYFSFEKKLERVLRVFSCRSVPVSLEVRNREGSRRISADNITYIEVSAHDVFIHTGTDTIRQWGTLTKIEQDLAGAHFARCSNSFLVNLKYVQRITRDRVTVAGQELTLSRTRHKEFLTALAQYKGGSV